MLLCFDALSYLKLPLINNSAINKTEVSFNLAWKKI